MKKNIYINRKKFQINQKKSNDVYIFAHDFFDNPHRFRWMIFEDFLEQIKFLEKNSSKNSKFKLVFEATSKRNR